MKKSMDNQTMNPIVAGWKRFAAKHETIAQFLVFFVVSNGVTVLQMIMMPVLKSIFGMTNLVDTGFQVLHCGSVGGSPYYVFDYAAGSIGSGGGGGLAYFLAVEITMLIAQVIAYLIISIGAAALQGLYKDPIYRFFQNVMGSAGITVADVVTMIINCAISFWVFFPIFKVIFKEEPEESK